MVAQGSCITNFISRQYILYSSRVMCYLMQVCALLQYKSVGDYIFLIMIYLENIFYGSQRLNILQFVIFFFVKSYYKLPYVSKKWENSFKHKVAIAKFIGKMQKKSGVMISWLEAMPLFFLDSIC